MMKFEQTPAINALLVCVSILCTLIVIEISLRSIGFCERNFYEYDKFTGYRLRPGFSGCYTTEGESQLKINSFGMNDDETSVYKPDDRFRVAVLGDSFTEAVQLDQSLGFPYLMERELSNCPMLSDTAVEVLNFGVGGYGTAEQVLTLRNHVWKFEPDYVVLVVTLANDLLDNRRPLHRKALENPTLPARSLAFRLIKQPSNFLTSQSVLAHLVWNSILGMRTISTQISNGPPRHRLSEDGIKDEVFQVLPNKYWEDNWLLMERLLNAFATETQRHEVGLLVASVSLPPQVFPDKTIRNEFMKAIGITQMFHPEARLRHILDRLGVQSLLLAPILQREADRTGVYFHGFPNTEMGRGHWNEAGHAIAADRISAQMCQSL